MWELVKGADYTLITLLVFNRSGPFIEFTGSTPKIQDPVLLSRFHGD